MKRLNPLALLIVCGSAQIGIAAVDAKCTNPSTMGEKLTCENRDLALIDRQMNTYYRRNLDASNSATVGPSLETFTAARDLCKTPECIIEAYRVWHDELSAKALVPDYLFHASESWQAVDAPPTAPLINQRQKAPNGTRKESPTATSGGIGDAHAPQTADWAPWAAALSQEPAAAIHPNTATTATPDDHQKRILSKDPEVAAALALYSDCLERPDSESCSRRDRAFAKLRTEGICPVMMMNETIFVDFCRPSRDPSIPTYRSRMSGDFYYFATHTFRVANQLRQCRLLESAGNLPAAESCRRTSQKADEYLLDRSTNGRAPASAWSLCEIPMRNDLALGARCIAAAESVCHVDDRGNLINRQECLDVLVSGAWVTNPNALALILD